VKQIASLPIGRAAQCWLGGEQLPGGIEIELSNGTNDGRLGHASAA
jgi:hypothetical protein